MSATPRFLAAGTVIFGILLAADAGGGGLRLEEYLRFSGTQLDLRGSAVRDADLVGLREPAFGLVDTILLTRTAISSAGLAHLAHLPLTAIDLYRTAVSDEGLSYLKDLRLKKINLTGTGVTDGGLSHLAAQPLEELSLRDTAITDQGLTHLRGLPLRILNLSRTAVTNRGLELLGPQPLLEFLDIADTAIGDGGMEYLAALPRIRTILLVGAPLSAGAVTRLRVRRPEVQVKDARAER